MFRGCSPKVVLSLLSVSIAIYVGVLNLIDRSTLVEVWDGIAWIENQQEGLIADKIHDPAASASRVGIQIGDRLLEVEDIRIRGLDDYIEVLEVLAESTSIGVPVTYLVEKASKKGLTSYAVNLKKKSQLTRIDVLLSIVGFLHLGIGLIIFLKKWKTKGAFHFYLLCLTSFFLYLCRYSGRGDAFDILIYWIGAISLLLLPPLFLHFCSTFPEVFCWFGREEKRQLVFYLPGAMLLITHAVWFLGLLQPMGFPRAQEIGYFFDRIHLAHFGIVVSIGACVLIQAGRRVQKSLYRKQMKWLSYGVLVSLGPFLGLYVLPYFLGFSIYPIMELSILSLALLPLCFGYAIAKYRLIDVEQIFRESASYLLASWILLVCYVGIVLLVGGALHNFSPQASFSLFSFSALLVAFLFAPVKNRIQKQIDRYFYKDTYDYRQSFADFGKSLGSEVSLPSLLKKISSRVKKTFDLSCVAIFLRSSSRSDRFTLYHSLGFEVDGEQNRYIQVMNPLSGCIDSQDTFHFQKSDSEDVEHLRSQLSSWGIRYLQPLQNHGRVIGLVGLGDRANGDGLSSNDLDLVAVLADYAAIALDNAVLYRSLETKASELHRLKAYNERVIQSITAGVVVVNSDGVVRIWNSFMESLYGVEADQIVGRHIHDVLPADLIQSLSETLGNSWRTEETRRLYKTLLKSSPGTSCLVNIHISPFLVQEDALSGTLLLFDDVTEKVKLENQLLQAEKLTSIGLLAAGVAHEVNTPLAGISSYTQMLLASTSPSDSRREVLEKIEKQSFRASEIVNNLVNFARVSDSDFGEVNLNSLMLETLSLLEHQLRSNSVEVSLSLDPSLPCTVGHGGKLQQVFVNLFMNAQDAMPSGGQITVRSYCEKSGIVVEVADTGEGISQEVVSQIYDPFFTTKDVGKGTGLGLSVCYGILQEHSGSIQVQSRVGEGSKFMVNLPVKRIH